MNKSGSIHDCIRTLISGLIRAPITVTTNPDQTISTITLPGYGYNDLDRTGHVAIWTVSRMEEASRMLLFQNLPQNPEWTKKLFLEQLLFTRAVHVWTTNQIRDASNYFTPLICKVQLAKVGKSSLSILQETSCKGHEDGSERVLHKACATLVAVDKKTFQVNKLPDFVQEIFTQRTERETIHTEEAAKEDPPPKPDNAHVHQGQVFPSDTDTYRHLNEAAFIRFCHDRASVLSRQGSLTHYHGELATWRVTEAHAVYHSPVASGDQLDIFTWEDENSSDLLHFQIEKDGSITFQCSLRFEEKTPTAEA